MVYWVGLVMEDACMESGHPAPRELKYYKDMSPWKRSRLGDKWLETVVSVLGVGKI